MGLQIVQGILLIAFAPSAVGLLNWLKARGQGRKRKLSFILQPYWDLYKLFGVPVVNPQTASWVFSITPWVVFIAYALLAFAIPVLVSPPLLAIDLIVVVYILGLARFTLSLAGWDTGAAFGGLGNSREMFLHFLTEIGLIFVLAALALRWNTLDLTRIMQEHSKIFLTLDTWAVNLGLVFLPIAVAGIILFEIEHIPVGNPETHLELTMAQKAITLEFAGRDLALIEWGEMIKLTFLFTLFGNLFLPLDANHWFSNLLLFAGRGLVFVLGLTWWELRQPRMRLRRVSRLAWGSILFSLITIIFITASRSPQ